MRPDQPSRAADERGRRPRAARRDGRHGPVRVVVLTLLAGLLTGLLGGCDLRLETPPPPARTPTADETVRARTLADARALAGTATAAAAAPAVAALAAEEPLRAALAQVVGAAAAHVSALGGDASPATGATGGPSPAPTGTTDGGTAGTTSTAAPTPSPADVVSLLATAAGTAGADALDVPDGGLAGLVASVAVSRWSSARALAAAAGAPEPSWVLPVRGATPSPTPTPDTAPTPASTVGPDPATTPGPAAAAGVRDADAVALARAEDAAGYALEVVAAVLGGDERARALADARVHRDRAEAWARAAEVAGTAQDPRRVAYALPADVEDAAVAQAVARDAEGGVAAAYAAALARADRPAARPEPLERLRAATDAAAAWGAPPTSFPGRPDLG